MCNSHGNPGLFSAKEKKVTLELPTALNNLLLLKIEVKKSLPSQPGSSDLGNQVIKLIPKTDEETH